MWRIGHKTRKQNSPIGDSFGHSDNQTGKTKEVVTLLTLDPSNVFGRFPWTKSVVSSKDVGREDRTKRELTLLSGLGLRPSRLSLLNEIPHLGSWPLFQSFKVGPCDWVDSLTRTTDSSLETPLPF